MKSTSTPPLPLPVSKFCQMLARNRVRVWRSQRHIPTKYYRVPPPHLSPSRIKTLPNAGQEQGKGLEESAAHTHQILWRVPPPHLSPSRIKILPNAGQEQGKGLEESAAHTHQILWRVPPPHPSPFPYQNSTKYQEQGKGLEELVENTHQILWRVPPLHLGDSWC